MYAERSVSRSDTAALSFVVSAACSASSAAMRACASDNSVDGSLVCTAIHLAMLSAPATRQWIFRGAFCGDASSVSPDNKSSSSASVNCTELASPRDSGRANVPRSSRL